MIHDKESELALFLFNQAVFDAQSYIKIIHKEKSYIKMNNLSRYLKIYSSVLCCRHAKSTCLYYANTSLTDLHWHKWDRWYLLCSGRINIYKIKIRKKIRWQISLWWSVFNYNNERSVCIGACDILTPAVVLKRIRGGQVVLKYSVWQDKCSETIQGLSTICPGGLDAFFKNNPTSCLFRTHSGSLLEIQICFDDVLNTETPVN